MTRFKISGGNDENGPLELATDVWTDGLLVLLVPAVAFSFDCRPGDLKSGVVSADLVLGAFLIGLSSFELGALRLDVFLGSWVCVSGGTGSSALALSLALLLAGILYCLV